MLDLEFIHDSQAHHYDDFSHMKNTSIYNTQDG